MVLVLPHSIANRSKPSPKYIGLVCTTHAARRCKLVQSDLNGGIHGSAHVHESKYFFGLLVILSVKTPTHIYFNNHIL